MPLARFVQRQHLMAPSRSAPYVERLCGQTVHPDDLWANYSDAELLENLQEGAAVVDDIKAGAPPEVYAAMSVLIQTAVGDERWMVIAAAISV